MASPPIVAVTAIERVVAALAHDGIVRRRAGDRLVDRVLGIAVALDLGQDLVARPVLRKRERDLEARGVDDRGFAAVDVEQRPPDARGAAEVEAAIVAADGKTVEIAEVGHGDGVLVEGAGHHDVVEHHGTDVRSALAHGIGAAVVDVAGDLDPVVGTIVGRRARVGAGDRQVLEQRVAREAEQLDVARAVVVAGGAVVGEGRVDHRDRRDARDDRRAAVVVRIVADHVDAVLGVARDRAVDDRQLAGIGGLEHRDALGAAGDDEVVEDDVRAADVAPDGDGVAGGRIDHHLADAEERDALADGEALGIGPRGDHDRVAGLGRVDRGLDGGEAAIADEKDVG
ncbi:MAG: hypothetical protein J0I48_09510, partial [Devosia sp.]|nr:hypothetical protein [Devosia sp.]